jgi:hypothetical protein
MESGHLKCECKDTIFSLSLQAYTLRGLGAYRLRSLVAYRLRSLVAYRLTSLEAYGFMFKRELISKRKKYIFAP